MSQPPPPALGASSPQSLVQQSYDAIADAYGAWNADKCAPRLHYTQAVLDLLPPGASVLELGCGAGEPILSRLVADARVARVYANDLSARQLALAQRRCPAATFLAGDMLALEGIAGESLDAAVGFFSVFHLPRAEQGRMLRKVWGWLREGGVFAFNLAAEDAEVVKGDFFGREMFWSGWGVERSEALVREVGFEVLRCEVLTVETEDEEDPDFGKKFLWFLVRKGGGEAGGLSG